MTHVLMRREETKADTHRQNHVKRRGGMPCNKGGRVGVIPRETREWPGLPTPPGSEEEGLDPVTQRPPSAAAGGPGGRISVLPFHRGWNERK